MVGKGGPKNVSSECYYPHGRSLSWYEQNLVLHHHSSRSCTYRTSGRRVLGIMRIFLQPLATEAAFFMESKYRQVGT